MTTSTSKPENTHSPNTKQQKCIDNIYGKYLVLAGPGTGKTFTVVHRLKAMLDNGINPEKILLLSFSDSAANEMQKKIEDFFKTSDLGVNIYTYHSFCNEIISQNIEAFGISDNYKIITETISKQFLKECIDEYNPIAYRNDKNDPYVYYKQIKKSIEEIKRFRLTKTQYFNNIKQNPDYEPMIELLKKEKEELINEKKQAKRIEKIPSLIEAVELKIQKAKEIWDYYELYKAKMEAEQYLDFDDMISYVLDKFESSPAFLDKIANKYEFIMVDEYQDTNRNQNKIVFDLVHSLKTQNVFVVGDDDQIIYSFQGANLDTIEGFLTEFPDTEVICLTENMRSTQNILDVARLIACEDKRRLEINPNFSKYKINKNLISKNPNLKNKETKVKLKEYYNQEQEFQNIVDEIEQLISSPNCPIDKDTKEKKLSEIAILMTGHSDIETISQLLKDRNIPAEVKYGTKIFEIKSAIVLYYYLQTLINPDLYSHLLFRLLLLPPFNFDTEDYKILSSGYSFGKNFLKTMQEAQNWKEKEKIKNFISDYNYLKEFSSNETVRNTVLEIGSKTGIFEYFLNEKINRLENISALKKLIDEAKDFSSIHNKISLEEFVEYLQMIEKDRDLELRIEKPDTQLNAIQISTYHSSKGREYEYVYMPTLQSKRWESNSKSFKPTIPVDIEDWKDEDYWKTYKLSDAIKTMYVGLTRAKHSLNLSYYVSGSTKLNTWISKAKDSGLLDIQKLSNYTPDTHIKQVEKSLTKRTYDYKRDFKNQIDNSLKNKYYSISSANKYLKCPRMFLYDDILNFAAISGNPDALSYGSAVHKALEFMVNSAIKNNFYPTKDEFISKFKQSLNKLPTSDFEQRNILEGRGENELNKYYPILTTTPINSLVKAEYELKTQLDGINFVGYIDLVVKQDDGTYKLIDYKTGKPSTITSIAPEKDHEDYYNQLCLYKYYFEKINNVEVSKTGFIYTLKPDKPVEKNYTKDETKAVVDKFNNAIKRIENHDFEPTYNKTFCNMCGYRAFCKTNTV